MHVVAAAKTGTLSSPLQSRVRYRGIDVPVAFRVNSQGHEATTCSNGLYIRAIIRLHLSYLCRMLIRPCSTRNLENDQGSISRNGKLDGWETNQCLGSFPAYSIPIISYCSSPDSNTQSMHEQRVHTLAVQISIQEVHVKREVHTRFLQIIKGESFVNRAQRLDRIRSAQAAISSVVGNREKRADNGGI